MQKYKIIFNLKNIDPNNLNNNNPYELHFNIINSDNKIESRLTKDFIFQLKNQWIVSANNGNLKKANRWYIKGSEGHREGNKKYYNQDNRTFYFREEFVNELLEENPSIREKEHAGEFDLEKGIMKINK